MTAALDILLRCFVSVALGVWAPICRCPVGSCGGMFSHVQRVVERLAHAAPDQTAGGDCPCRPADEAPGEDGDGTSCRCDLVRSAEARPAESAPAPQSLTACAAPATMPVLSQPAAQRMTRAGPPVRPPGTLLRLHCLLTV